MRKPFDKMGLDERLNLLAQKIRKDTGVKASVREVYEDFGQGRMWNNIIIDDGGYYTYQLLYPREMDDLLLANYSDFLTLVNNMETRVLKHMRMNGKRTRAPAKKRSPAVKVNVRRMF